MTDETKPADTAPITDAAPAAPPDVIVLPVDPKPVVVGSADAVLPTSSPADPPPPAPPTMGDVLNQLDAANAKVAALEMELNETKADLDAGLGALTKLPVEVVCTTCGTRCPVTH